MITHRIRGVITDLPVDTRKNLPSGLKEMCIGVKLTKASPKSFKFIVLV